MANNFETNVLGVVDAVASAATELQASAGTQEVSSNIAGVTAAAAETGSAANQVLAAARELG